MNEQGWGSSWNKLRNTEHLCFSELPLLLYSVSKCLNLLYYLCFYVVLGETHFPLSFWVMAANGNDDNMGLSHTVKKERKAAGADYHFSRCQSRVKVAMVINYKCRSFPNNKSKVKQRTSTDNYVPSVYCVWYTVRAGYKIIFLSSRN